MAYRKINSRGIWRGESEALDEFADAWAIDCKGSDETFLRVYGWTDEALQEALGRAFPNYDRPSMVDMLES